MGNPIAFPVIRSTIDSSQDAARSLLKGESVAEISSLRRSAFREKGDAEQVDARRAFVAVSLAMREVRRDIDQVARVDAGVLILGESGTGKEVIARLIHKLSSRAPRKFMKVNCAALPAELLESELFGYEVGAFIGAQRATAGRFENCNKGTIFLDEIAEMSVSAQAKLIRVLQDGESSRLGSAATIQVDVRVIAATNVDVQKAVHAGTLRSDLYYRLNVFTIRLPALRDRREDIPYLLNHFMTTWSASYGRPRISLHRRALEACASYHWPGNVRELENFVKRCLVVGDVDQVVDRLGSEAYFGHPAPEPSPDLCSHPSLQAECTDLKSMVHGPKHDAERTAIVQALEKASGSRQEAARILGISLRALYDKTRHYGVGEPYEVRYPDWIGQVIP
jgi:two-component system, NtrC family, response regulator AtoC